MPSYKELKLQQLKKKYETQYGATQQDADLQASKDISQQEEENDKGNVWQQIMGGFHDIGDNIGKGFWGLFEGIIDAGAGLVGALSFNDDFKKGVQEFQNIDLADYVQKGTELLNPVRQVDNLISTGNWYDPFDFDSDNKTNDITEKSFINNMSETGQSLTRGIAQALGQVAGQILTVGTTTALGASANVARGIGMTALGASSFGSGMTQANQEGASFDESFKYGALNAGKEVGTELLVGGAVSKISGVPSAIGGALVKGEKVGSSIFSRFQNKAIKSFASEGAKKFLRKIVSEFTEEGLEEAVGSLVEPVIQKWTYKKDKSVSEIFEENGGWGGVLEDFLVGGISGGIAGGLQTGVEVRAVGKQLGSTTIKGDFEAYGVQDAIAQICDVDEQLAIELLKIKGGLNENVDLDLLKNENNVRDFVEKYAKEQGKFTKEGDINNEAKKIADLIKQRENIQNKFTNAFEEYAKQQGLELENMADANGNVEVNETTLGKLRAIDTKNQFNERATATKETLVKEGVQNVFGNKVKVEFGNTNNFDASNNKITLNKNSNDSVAKLLASLGHESEHKFGTKKFRTQMLKAMGITETQLNDMANKYALRKGRDSSGKFTNYEKLFKEYAKTNNIKEGTQEYSDARKEYFKDEIVADLLGVYVSNNIDELQRSIKRSDAGLLKRGMMNIQDLFKGHEAKQFRKAMNYFAEGIKEDTKTQNKAKKEAEKQKKAEKNTQTNANVKPVIAYSLDDFSKLKGEKPVDLSKVKINDANNQIIEDENTRVYFDYARYARSIAKENFNDISQKIFVDIAKKYGLSLQINDNNGNTLKNPSIKSLNSFASKLYINQKTEGKSQNQINGLRDWVRGTYIFNENNIKNFDNIVKDIAPYLDDIIVKNKEDYKGVHFLCKFNGIPVEIQFHTKKSWQVKAKTEVFYERWRNVDDINKSNNENYNDGLKETTNSWNLLLETDQAFSNLRKSSSEIDVDQLKSSLPQAISKVNALDLSSTTNSLESKSNSEQPAKSKTSPVSTNLNIRSINNSSLSNEIIPNKDKNVKYSLDENSELNADEVIGSVNNSKVNYKKIKLNNKDSVIEDENTKPLFSNARFANKTAKNNLSNIKTNLFEKIANKYGLKIVEPNVKNVSLFVNEMYKRSSTDISKIADWVSGTVVIDESNVSKINDIINEYSKSYYIVRADTDAYESRVLDASILLLYDNIPVRIYFATQGVVDLKEKYFAKKQSQFYEAFLPKNIDYFKDYKATAEPIIEKNKNIVDKLLNIFDYKEISLKIKNLQDNYWDNNKVNQSNVDSEGNKLPKAVAERNKNSKARDSKGRLLVLYHGSPNNNFTIFDSNKHSGANQQPSADKYKGRNVNWFTASKDTALTYITEDESGLERLPAQVDNISSIKELKKYLDGYLKSNSLYGDNQIKVKEVWYKTNEDAKLRGYETHYWSDQITESNTEKDGYKKGIKIDYSQVNDFYDEPIYYKDLESVKEHLWEVFETDETQYGLADYEDSLSLKRVYLNIEKPLIVDAKGKNWNNIDFKEAYSHKVIDDDFVLKNLDKLTLEDFKVLSEYGEGLEEINNLKTDEEAREFYKKWRKGFSWKVYHEVPVNFKLGEKPVATTRSIVDYALEQGDKYDGIIIKNVIDNGGGASFGRSGGMTDIYITLNDANQIKNIDNTNPTDNEDIRYSLDDNSSFEDYELTEKDLETYIPKNIQRDVSKIQNKTSDFEDFEGSPSLKSKKALAIVSDCRNVFDEMYDDITSIKEELEELADKGKYNTKEFSELFNVFRAKLKYLSDIVSVAEEYVENVDTSGDYVNDITDNQQELLDQRIEEAEDLFSEIEDSDYNEYLELVDEYLEQIEKENNNGNKENDIQRILEGNRDGDKGTSNSIGTLSSSEWRSGNAEEISELSQRLLREEYNTDPSNRRLDIIVDSDGNEYLVNAYNFTYNNLQELFKTIDPETKQMLSDYHTLEEFKNAKLCLTSADGKSTVCVLENGDIINLINTNEEVRGFTSKAFKLAIDNGGIKMDNYNIPLSKENKVNLTYLYSKNGFIPVSSTPYNAEFVNEKIRENFTKKNNGEPIMFMKYTGENKPVFDSYEECQEYVKQNVVSFDDWDEASNYRDENIKDAKDKLNSFKKNETSAKPKYGKDNTTYQRVVEDNASTSQDYDLENSFGWKGKGKNSYAQKVRSLDRVLNISKEELKKISISELSNRLVEAQQIIDNIYSQYEAIKKELSNSKLTKEERKALLEKLGKIAQNGILDIYTNTDNAETGLLRNVEQLLNEYTDRYKTEKNKDGLLNPKNMDIEQIESDIFDIKEYYEESEISQKAQEQIEEKVKKLKEQKVKEKKVVKKTAKPNTAKYEKKIDALNKKYDDEIVKEKELLKKIRTLMTERTILNEKANNAWKKVNSLKLQLVNAVESSKATTEQLKKQAREMNKNLKKENTSLRAKNRTLVNQNASLQSDLTGVKKIPSTFRATLNTLFDNNLVYDDKTYKEIVKDLSKGNIDGVIDKLLQTKYRNKSGKTVVEKDLKDILSQSDKELLGEVLQEYLEGKKDSARTRWLNAYKEIKKIAEISITLARTHKGLRVRIERKGTSTASPILASVKALGDLIKTPTRANITNGSFREGLGTFYKQFKAHKAEIGVEMPPILENMLEDILSNQDKPTLQEIEKYPEVLRGIRNFIDTISGTKEVVLYRDDGTTFKIKVKDIAVEGVKNQKRQAKIQGAKGSILHKVLWTVDPRVTMQYMDGKGSKDGIMHQFYNRFVMAQYIDKPKLYNELVRPLEDFNRDNADFIKSLKKEKITIKIADQEISITKGEALSLYNLIKDDGAYRHIIDKAGGLEINGKKIQNITQEDMLNFESQMVETFKLNDKSAVANKYLQLQRQLLDKAGKVKYQTDINNYGISNIDVKVDEDYNPVLDENGEIQFNSLYFPIQTSDLSLSTDLTPGKIQQTTVAHTKQMSFNYNRTSYSGAIVVNDIDEVLQSHLNQMTTYGALSNVIEDFNQVLNRKIDTEMANGETDLIGSSILNTLNERFGKSKNGGFYANDFFKNWIADIQGITRDSATLQDKGLKSFFGKIRGNFARFVLYANFKVAVSQTVSYFNASKYIQWKNLALATKTTMKSVAPIPDYYDYRNRSNAITSAYTLYDTAQDKLNILGKPITMADSFTIRNIWKAVCIQEHIDNNTDVNSEAYKKAEMLFIKTVSETQPMYDKFSRSRMLNTNSEIMKALLMFQTQNNKNWSNFVEMIINKDSLSGRQIGRTVVGLASSMIFYAMLTELFKHLIRDNDDDDKFFDEDLAIQTLNGVFAMLPIIGTQVQFNSKFRPELNELSIGAIAQINDVFETMNDITNGNFSGLSAKEYVDAIGKLTGIPTNNIYHIIDDCYREVAKHSNDSVVNSYVDFKSGYNGYKNTNKSLVTTELAKNNNQLAKGYYRKWSNNIMQLNDKAIDNLYGLYKDGVDVSFKQIPSYYNNEFGEQVLIDQNKFKKTYSMASEKVNQLNSSYAFTSLTKEQKVYALKKVFTTYYDLAKKEQTGEKLKLIEALAKTNYNLSNAITHLAKINDIKETTNNTRKEMVVKYINRLSTTAQNKYIIFMLAGYKCPESKKKMVQVYLRRYLPISLIKEILE